MLTVDLEQAPYAFVQVQGVAEVTEELGEVRRIATLAGARYMGADRAEEFGARNGVPGELGVRLRPTKVDCRPRHDRPGVSGTGGVRIRDARAVLTGH